MLGKFIFIYNNNIAIFKYTSIYILYGEKDQRRLLLSRFIYFRVAFCFHKMFSQLLQDKLMGAVSVFMTGNYPRQPVDVDGPLSLRC